MISIKYSKRQFDLADKKNIAFGYCTNSNLSGVDFTPLNYDSYNIENNLITLITDKSYYNHIIQFYDGTNNYYYLIDFVYKQDEKAFFNNGKFIIKESRAKSEQEFLISYDTLDLFQDDDIENCSFDCFVEETEEEENNDVIFVGEYITPDDPKSNCYVQSQNYNQKMYSTIALAPNKSATKNDFEIKDDYGTSIYSHEYYEKSRVKLDLVGRVYTAIISEWLTINNDSITNYYIAPGGIDLSTLKLVSYEKKYEINNVSNFNGVDKIIVHIKTYFYITTPRSSHILEYNYSRLFTDIYNNTLFITRKTKFYFDIYKGVVVFVNNNYQKAIETMKTTVFLEKSDLENFIDKHGQTMGSVLGLIGSTASLIGGVVTANPMPILAGVTGIANSSVNIAKNVINSEHYKDYAYKINQSAGIGYLNCKMYKNYKLQCYTKSVHRSNNYYLVKKNDSIILIFNDLTILAPKGMYKIINF